MKLLQLNTTINSGSTGRIAEDIGRVLQQRGHESSIAFGRNERPSQSTAIRVGSQFEIYRHAVKSYLLDGHGFGSKRATEQLIKTIETWQPDLIGMHNLHGYYLHVGVLFDYLKRANIPVVWTLHDCWSFTGHCAFFDRVDCRKWETECHACPLKSRYPASLIDNSRTNFRRKKRTFQGLDRLVIVTPSHWLKGHVQQSFLKDYPVRVIHNGIDLQTFQPQADADQLNARYGLADKKVILGVASIWDERKGLADFVALAEQLPEEVRIVLVGLSPKQISGLPPQVIGIARTESVQELAQWYSRADVFANPTYSDNFPTTNIEALACGTPVVTYRTGGSPESVCEDTGFVVDRGDRSGLWRAIQAVFDRDQPAYRSACRTKAEKHYDQHDRYLDYLRLYESLVTPTPVLHRSQSPA